MTLFNTGTSITKSLVACVLVAGSFAAAATGATAADLSHNGLRSAHAVHRRVPVHTAGRTTTPYERPYGFDVGAFIESVLGGPLPPQYAQIVRNAMRERGRYATSKGTYGSGAESPTYDYPAPIDNSASDAAAAQAASDSAALAASMQAAQQQNDEANAETNAGIAAAQQIEINGGM